MDERREQGPHHTTSESDWDPVGPDVRTDQRAAYDAMRERCPVAHAGSSHWTVFRHADVVRVVTDHATFSNGASRYPSVPNGMDPPEHTVYRRVVEAYFSPARVEAFEPVCRQIASALVDAACRQPPGGPPLPSARIEVMQTFALPFAAQVQCAYFGWPISLSPRLIDWARRNHEATLAGDRVATTAVAAEFERLIDDLLRARDENGTSAPRDLTESLLRERVNGRPLDRSAIASVLRNCTMGEVGTIAASVGIVLSFLAEAPDIQEQLRRTPTDLQPAIDEILRLHGPLVDNRRVATCATAIGNRQIEPGARVVVNWMAANRDPRVFADASEFRLGRDAADNLLYGAGIHVCPGAPLARLELRVLTEALLAATVSVRSLPDHAARLAVYPSAGYASLPLQLTPHVPGDARTTNRSTSTAAE